MLIRVVHRVSRLIQEATKAPAGADHQFEGIAVVLQAFEVGAVKNMLHIDAV